MKRNTAQKKEKIHKNWAVEKTERDRESEIVYVQEKPRVCVCSTREPHASKEPKNEIWNKLRLK